MEGFEVHMLPHPVNFRVLELVRKMSVSQKQVVEVAAQLWSWGKSQAHGMEKLPPGKLRVLSHFSTLQTFFSVNQPVRPLGTQAESGSSTQSQEALRPPL